MCKSTQSVMKGRVQWVWHSVWGPGLFGRFSLSTNDNHGKLLLATWLNWALTHVLEDSCSWLLPPTPLPNQLQNIGHPSTFVVPGSSASLSLPLLWDQGGMLIVVTHVSKRQCMKEPFRFLPYTEAAALQTKSSSIPALLPFHETDSTVFCRRNPDVEFRDWLLSKLGEALLF